MPLLQGSTDALTDGDTHVHIYMYYIYIDIFASSAVSWFSILYFGHQRQLHRRLNALRGRLLLCYYVYINKPICIYVCIYMVYTYVYAYISVRMCKPRAVSGLYLVGRLSGYSVGLPESCFTNYIYVYMYVYLIVCHIGCSMRQLCTQNEHDCINAALSLLTK